MANSIYKHIRGMEQVTALLQNLPREVVHDVLPGAVRDAAVPVEKWAKRFAKRSERTGALHASIGVVLRKYPRSAKVVAMIGPQRGYFCGSKRVPSGEQRRGSESPSHYAHLIEFGHRAVSGGSLRPEYNLVSKATGKLSTAGKPIRRWVRGTIKKVGNGRSTGWVPARPFIRPAAIMSQTESAVAFTESSMKGVERVRRKYIREGKHIS